MSYICPTFIGSTERNTSKTQVMKKNVSVKEGDRIIILSGFYANRTGTVYFNKHVRWFILLDSETRPANIFGQELYLIQEYRKNFVKI